MAVIDLKNTIVKIYDGKDFDATGIVAVPIIASEGDFSLQASIMASPDAPISFTMVDPGGTVALSIVVTGRDVVVNLETSSSVVVTTANLLEAAILADPVASGLVTIIQDELGTGILEALSEVNLTSPNSITIKIGEGNLTYSEKRPVEFKLDRGNLDTVREGPRAHRRVVRVHLGIHFRRERCECSHSGRRPQASGQRLGVVQRCV